MAVSISNGRLVVKKTISLDGKERKKLLLSLLLEICFLFVFVDCTYGLRVHFLSGKKEIVFLVALKFVFNLNFLRVCVCSMTHVQ